MEESPTSLQFRRSSADETTWRTLQAPEGRERENSRFCLAKNVEITAKLESSCAKREKILAFLQFWSRTPPITGEICERPKGASEKIWGNLWISRGCRKYGPSQINLPKCAPASGKSRSQSSSQTQFPQIKFPMKFPKLVGLSDISHSSPPFIKVTQPL